MEQRLAEKYRSDREKLLKHIISSSSPNLISPSSSSLDDVNLNTISVDYVLRCIQSGGVLDFSQATQTYFHELSYPTSIHSQSGNAYFTKTEANSSGSPPKHHPPAVGVQKKKNAATTRASSQANKQSLDHKIASWKNEISLNTGNESVNSLKSAGDCGVPVLGLHPLQTGLSDDDLKESAYEVLVASLAFSGVEVCELGKKGEKGSKLLAGLKGKKGGEFMQLQSQDRNLELLNTIRTQLEVSEARDLYIRQSLGRYGSRGRGPCGQMDVLQMVLGLLNYMSRSSFTNEKSYIQWKLRQASVLEELFCVGPLTAEYPTVKHSIEKIRIGREWDTLSAPERAEILLSIRNSALKVSSKPEIGDENCRLASGYHFKTRLYEMLLCSLFDILDEGQLLVEADEVLKLIKLTWSALGITQVGHDALWGWVLFKQFVQTGVELLLEYATVQVQRVLEDGSLGEDGQHLACTVKWKRDVLQLKLVPAILLSMYAWCDFKLRDYHRQFVQNPSRFRKILIFSIAAGVLDVNERGKLTRLGASTKTTSRRLRRCIESSIQAAYMQVLDNLEVDSNSERTHPLALLANSLKLIAETECAVFCPVLIKWCPKAGIISSTKLYQVFRERLGPFLEGLSCLSQDVKLVLSAAHSLDRVLCQLYSIGCKEDILLQRSNPDLDHYRIGEVSGPLILDWVISQHSHILDWVERAFNLEEWEPLSSQQKHAVSVVEVFRMIEETVDQFFRLKLPVNITHLQAVLSVVIHSLDAYISKIVCQLVEKRHVYPPVPTLTRYEETLVPISRKKMTETITLDENPGHTLNEMTISKLCIRLNTLQYIRNQIGVLEDGMRKSWGNVRPSANRRWFNVVEEEAPENLGRMMSISDESVDELFATTFDGIRNAATDSVTKIIDFIGTKVAFWDLREHFLYHLYHGGVERARMDSVLPHIDSVLDNLCGLVDDVVRDPVVLSIFRALLEGYLWVLLDGGPSRAFSDSDVTLMEDDLNTLKDFFVANGEGLPRSTVEREAKFAHQVLSLFSLQASNIIQMLLSASEHISTGLGQRSDGHRSLDDANTLIRILCHKMDREASKFLRRQYQFPPSSDYDENPKNESSTSAAIISDLFKRSASFRFPETGHSSFKSLKKKFQEAW